MPQNQPSSPGGWPYGHRPIHIIAREIIEDWSKAKGGIYFGAVPYLQAMKTLTSIKEDYYADSAQSVVIYFLANANTWRGEVARRVKKELKALAGIK